MISDEYIHSTREILVLSLSALMHAFAWCGAATNMCVMAHQRRARVSVPFVEITLEI